MRLRTLSATTAATVATAAIGSVASRRTRTWWCARLDKPSFQPPSAAFPVVWTGLYADIAVTSGAALDRLDEDDPTAARAYRRALALNLALNASWTWVFFAGRRLTAATLVAGALTVSSADLVRRSGRVDRRLGASLAPYAAWCAFATLLAGAIRRRNR